ncbi:hypothetical protein HDU77_004046 [Chytriomyces hyalinus]|nr:hypothetical protein HDU77_004046 [Chytriomyces hyalinus]
MDGLQAAIISQFDWNLGCPTVLDWLQTRAFFLLENLVQSCEVADLPYSIIAAGVFKAVTVDLMPDQELDLCFKFTGYTDEQLYKVTRHIPDEAELEFRMDCVVSVNADVLVQAKYGTVAPVAAEVGRCHRDVLLGLRHKNELTGG